MRRLAVAIALIFTLPPAQLRAQQRACEPARNPKQLPAVAALVDSAIVVTGLATIDAPEGLLFSLALRAGDSVPLVRPLFGTDSTAAGIVASAIRPQKRADESWAVRLLAVGGPALVLRIERASQCPPVFIAGPLSSGVTAVRIQDVDERAIRSASQRPSGFMALVSDSGLPLRVNMIGSTGIPELDRQMMENWYDARFKPALLDGLPVQAWYRSDGARSKPPELPPADDDSVYLESEVEDRPYLVWRPNLTYPDELRSAGIQGQVVVHAIIDKKGRVEPKSVWIETSYNGFTQPATSMVLRAKFQPGSIRGKAVRVRVHIPIDFTIKE